jgi:hypothetical protein
MTLGSIQFLKQMSAKDLPGGEGQTALEADNLSIIRQFFL